MEVCNTIVINENNIDEAINTININRIVDDVVERIESISDNDNDNEHTDHSIDIITLDTKKPKHSECTICTESVSDSSSEPESENFKCDVCSNLCSPNLYV